MKYGQLDNQILCLRQSTHTICFKIFVHKDQKVATKNNGKWFFKNGYSKDPILETLKVEIFEN